MSELTRIEVNCTTGEVLEIALTAQEIAERDQQAAAWAEEQAAREAEATAKAIARTALLARLGISEEEAELLK